MGGDHTPMDSQVIEEIEMQQKVLDFLFVDPPAPDDPAARTASGLHILRVEAARPHAGQYVDATGALRQNDYIQLDGTTVSGIAAKGFIAFYEQTGRRRPLIDKKGWIRVDLPSSSMPFVIEQLRQGTCYLTYVAYADGTHSGGLHVPSYGLFTA